MFVQPCYSPCFLFTLQDAFKLTYTIRKIGRNSGPESECSNLGHSRLLAEEKLNQPVARDVVIVVFFGMHEKHWCIFINH
jgi:hypothetical protein